jgi:hypothetical protein
VPIPARGARSIYKRMLQVTVPGCCTGTFDNLVIIKAILYLFKQNLSSLRPYHLATPFNPRWSRVSDICKYISNKHYLTLAEFIRVYITTQGDDGYRDRPATRAKRLADAIYTQPEVLEALQQHPASGSAGIITVKALRKEMKALEEAGDTFGAYQVDRGQEKTSPASIGQEEQPGDSQKLEDYKVVLGDMQFGQMFEEVNTRAPMLFGLLDGLIAPKTERKDRAPRDPSKFNRRIAMITSILCYSRASENASYNQSLSRLNCSIPVYLCQDSKGFL